MYQTFYTAALNVDIDEIVKVAIFGSKRTYKYLKIKFNHDIDLTKKILNIAKELQYTI